MDGARKAALYLHGLANADREWLLSQLSGSQHGSLRELLVELQELGIPNEPLLDAASIAAEPAIAIPDTQREPQPECDVLHGTNPDAVVQLLIDEPVAVISALMRMSDWPWRGPLLEALSPLRREQLLASLISEAHVSPRVQAALLDAINSKIASMPTSMRVLEPRRAMKGDSLTRRWWRRIWPR